MFDGEGYRVKRHFSPHEATALVPFLEERFGRIGELREEVSELVESLEAEGVEATSPFLKASSLPPEQGRQLRALRTLVAEINDEIEAIQELGILVEDLDLGVVAFYAHLAGREVFLSWQTGEGFVDHWLPLGGEFADRQLVDEPTAFAAHLLN